MGANLVSDNNLVAEPTGLEPATSDVTERKSRWKKFANP